ncbi:hypothetical protein MMC24_006304 [Lignoscripta atroalba]|nr:hypothetical protein [Lignoscripta atroalba]
MAKGLRSSTEKTNRSKLRSRVFRPVETARRERLSAKLLELASRPIWADVGDVRMEEATSEGADQQKKQTDTKAASKVLEAKMDIDGGTLARTSSRYSGRIQKKGPRKASSSMVFPAYTKGRRLRARKKQKK